VQRAPLDAQRRLAQRLHALAPGAEPHAQVLSNERVAAGVLRRCSRSHAHAAQRCPRLRATMRRGPATRAKLVKQADMRLRLRVHLRTRHRRRRRTRRKLLLADHL
jgi:hypothetical protein